jgi:hypothetical protein
MVEQVTNIAESAALNRELEIKEFQGGKYLVYSLLLPLHHPLRFASASARSRELALVMKDSLSYSGLWAPLAAG